MENIIIDRIIELQEEVSPKSRSAFEVNIGKTSGYLAVMKKRGSYPSADLIIEICQKYTEYSVDWILGLSDEKFAKKNTDAVNEEGAIYETDIPKNDFLGLSKRIDLVIKQNSEILDKLNRGIAKDIIESETKRLESNNKQKK